jgi:flagella basal body P-ring formation protein FlgA
MRAQRILSRAVLWALAGLLLASGFGAAARDGGERVRLRLRTDAVVETEAVVLGDVVEVLAADAALSERLEGLHVARAPLPGQSRRLGRAYLLIRMRQAGVDPESFRMEGADSVEVRRAGIEVGRERIEAIARGHVEQRIERAGLEGEVASVHVPHSLSLPSGVLTHRVEAEEGEGLRGTVPVSVVFFVDGRPEGRVQTLVRVRVMAEVVTAARPLRRSRLLTADDLALSRMDLSDCPSNVFLHIEAAVGKRLKHSVDAFSPLREDQVELPPLVRRGDVVHIVAANRRIAVRTLGVVRDREGRKGDRVQVVNMDSDRSVYARVVDAKTVTVDF